MLKLLFAVVALTLAGCNTVMKPFNPPEELLTRCEEVPSLEGLDGKAVVL